MLLRKGVGDEVLVPPEDLETGASGIIHLPANVALVDAMGTQRIAQLVRDGSLVSFMERDPATDPERRGGQERRQTDRRRN